MLDSICNGLAVGNVELAEDWLSDWDIESEVRALYTRLAGAISTMICDPKFVVDLKLFEFLIGHKNTISMIFRASSFKNMNHIVHMSLQQGGGFNSKSDQFKALFASSVDLAGLSPHNMTQKLPEEERAAFWLGLVDRSYLLSRVEDEQWLNVILTTESLADCQIDQSLFLRLANIWMTCSYFDDSRKHEVKVTLNQILRNSLKSVGVKSPSLTGSRGSKVKPRLAVLAEVFRHDHAMYRSYARGLELLREKFHLVLVSLEGGYDEESERIFDEVVSFNHAQPLKKVIGKIIKVQPDMIYYPSLGMEIWTIIAAQLRLAPIQVMTLGHPATSMSDKIDYAIVPEGSLGDPDCFSETIVCTRNDAVPVLPHPDLAKVEYSQSKAEDGTIRIAVPSKGHKLSKKFLACLQTIQSRVAKPVEFHFFPNMSEPHLLILKEHIGKLVTSKFHKGTDYPSYMRLLGDCDIQLSPFPFGNTNGYIDGLLMGLPIVSLDGREVHSKIDNTIGKMAELPRYCMTNSVEEYVETVVRLVNNDAERHEVAKKTRNIDFDKVFFDRRPSDDFLEAMSWIYEHHEAIRESGKKNWAIEDRSSVL